MLKFRQALRLLQKRVFSLVLKKASYFQHTCQFYALLAPAMLKRKSQLEETHVVTWWGTYDSIKMHM